MAAGPRGTTIDGEMDEQTRPAGFPAARRRPGPISLGDILLAVLVFVVMVGGTAFHAAAIGSPLTPPAYALMAVAAVTLPLRHAWPRAVLAVTLAACVLYLAIGYTVGPIFLAASIAMYSHALRSTLATTLAAAGLGMGLLAAGHTPELVRDGWAGTATSPLDLLLWPLAFIGLPAAVGTIMRLRREEAQHLRDEQFRQAAFDERLRVAREVHDVVGHGLAVINMQAGIALHVINKRPDQAEVALRAIRTASKDALEELRGTLAVFRQPDGTAPRRPVAGLEQLDALVNEMRDSGLPVKLEVSGQRTAIPGAVNLAAYRIVQESLTNVLRHAGAASAIVRVGYEPDAVALEILDDGRGVDPRGNGLHGHGGHGITGMRERAAALGGILEVGPRPGGGFRVHARLPAGEMTGERG